MQIEKFLIFLSSQFLISLPSALRPQTSKAEGPLSVSVCVGLWPIYLLRNIFRQNLPHPGNKPRQFTPGLIHGLTGSHNQFGPHQGAIRALSAEGIPHQIKFVDPGAGDHATPHEKEITA